MNILPHKTWHVWRRDNIAKVERDEARHRKEIEEQRKKDLQEKRREQFRKLSGISSEEHISTEDNIPSTPQQDSNKERFRLFEDLEKKYKQEEKKTQRKNEELQQKMDGACPLGKCSIETMKNKPWYFDLPKKDEEEDVKHEQLTAREKRKKRIQEKTKLELDPLTEFNRYTKKSKESHHIKPTRKEKRKEKKAARLLSLREKRIQRETQEKRKTMKLLTRKQ